MKDYEVRENPEAKELRWEITAPLKDDPLGKALILCGALVKIDNLEFCIINNCPSIKFQTVAPTSIYVYPELPRGQALFENAIREAQKLEKILEAISLADGQASKEESR
jgi:hypothetical protein